MKRIPTMKVNTALSDTADSFAIFRKTTIIIVLVMTGLAACHDKDKKEDPTPAGASLNSQDQTFMQKTAKGSNAEIQLGQMAATQGSTNGVRAFGQMMVDDHTQASIQLMSVASNKSVTLDSTMDAKHQALKTQLSGLSGTQFDSVYMYNMVLDHRETQMDFETELSSGQSTDVRNFAAQNINVIDMHLQMADSIYFKNTQ
jgi:putative membrane protein